MEIFFRESIVSFDLCGDLKLVLLSDRWVKELVKFILNFGSNRWLSKEFGICVEELNYFFLFRLWFIIK